MKNKRSTSKIHSRGINKGQRLYNMWITMIWVTIVTNKYTPETTSISGEKVWDDKDNQDGRDQKKSV